MKAEAARADGDNQDEEKFEMDDGKDDSGDEMMNFLVGAPAAEEAGASAIDTGIIIGSEEDIHVIPVLAKHKKHEEAERNEEIEQLRRDIKAY